MHHVVTKASCNVLSSELVQLGHVSKQPKLYKEHGVGRMLPNQRVISLRT